jgi:class 3 adenylate cyclase
MEPAARLDPEDWQDVLRTTRAGEVVARHGGHAAQYFGDGILIYCSWPKTYDDAAERAARAALGLVEAAATGRADGTVLSVRVGLHTGPVVVRARGHDRREAREGRTRAA